MCFKKDGRIFYSTNGLELDNLKVAAANFECAITELQTELTSDAMLALQRHDLLHDLRKVASDHLNFRLRVFGSSVNGFRSKHSDCDVVMHLRNDGLDEQMMQLCSLLYNSNTFVVKKAVFDTCVPIIKIIHVKTDLECDISFSTPSIPRGFEVKNTILLRKYAEQNPAIPECFQLLKLVLSHTNFGSTTTGGFSTYTHIVMLIHFLTHQHEGYG